ncbi:acyltransferase [Sphingomonas gei]|uniref:Acyltransferase n=1 Tax=Sphingomonas gei TaxID=1395960 RepID=A0A4S1XBQ2_9SPHN|nr:acyltransferase family protein [Sphingomonas gei]TGX52770.1 acyltransferase [Sphingomonas gei]
MERHYGIDWLRIGAFALLILYHIGMFFVPWGWHVKTAQPLDWVQLPMLATNAWRLPLLFTVSGFATAALLGKSTGPASFLRDRTARLVLPTLFAAMLIIPPQPWIELMTQHGYAGSFWHFWVGDYFRFGTLDGIVLPTWQHLWFVVYLWAYTLVLVAILALTPAAARASFARFADDLLGGPGLLLVPLAWLAVHMAISGPRAEPNHALIGDWTAHRMYFPAFVFGFFLADAPRTWAAIRRWWRVAGVLAVLGFVVVAGILLLWLAGSVPDTQLRLPFAAGRLILGWCTIVALIGIADRWWNCDHRWRRTLTEAVFPFYLIHQTIIVMLGWYLLRFALPAGIEFVALLGATITGCWLFYLGGRRIGWLRPLIGLRRLASRPRSATAAPSISGVP